jgi:putative restriction endonuclease
VTTRKNWNRNELIIAFNLYCKIPFSKIYYKNPRIVEWARLIGRSSSSVALKLVNFGRLDPELQKRNIVGMRHGSKAEETIWNEFRNNWEELAFESERILAGYKHEPIEKSAGIEADYLPEEGKEKEAVVNIRVKQSFFRKTVLASYDYKCCITEIPIQELLVAGHIIPWSKDKKNRLNPSNGLCLNSLHDKAFDKGLITVTPDYKIKLSSVILKVKSNNLLNTFFLPFENKPIRLPQRFLPDKAFLEYHNNIVFVK